jgi:hypothetical protein
MSAWLAAGAGVVVCALACGVAEVEAAACAGGEPDAELSSAITLAGQGRNDERQSYQVFGSGTLAKQTLFCRCATFVSLDGRFWHPQLAWNDVCSLCI